MMEVCPHPIYLCLDPVVVLRELYQAMPVEAPAVRTVQSDSLRRSDVHCFILVSNGLRSGRADCLCCETLLFEASHAVRWFCLKIFKVMHTYRYYGVLFY